MFDTYIFHTVSTDQPSGIPFTPVGNVADAAFTNVPDEATPFTQSVQHSFADTSVASILI